MMGNRDGIHVRDLRIASKIDVAVRKLTPCGGIEPFRHPLGRILGGASHFGYSHIASLLKQSRSNTDI
jgi:hypothetical protein